MKSLLICLFSLVFSSTLYSQDVKIRVHTFDDSSSHILNHNDSLAVISLVEEEGCNNAYVIKLSDTKLMITIKCPEYDVQYILYDRYIELVVRYYPNKTLIYDKNFKLLNAKTRN